MLYADKIQTQEGRSIHMKQIHRKLFACAALITAFAVWTAAVCIIDVQPVGPLGSWVGFAKINLMFHRLTGVHLWLYAITDWLSLIPAAVCLGFGCLGLRQWIQRKRLLKVDWNLLVLGGFYVLVMAGYVLFERLAINCRPILIGGTLEVSYPSSTTLLVLCVMPTAAMQLRCRIRSKALRHLVLFSIHVFTVLMVFARLLCGVHWLSDIIGGVLLSAGLVMLYACLSFPAE